MRVTTSQYEIIFNERPKFTFAQSKSFPPKHNLLDRQFIGTSSIFALGKSRVFPTDPPFYPGEITMTIGRCSELEEQFA